MGGSTSLKARHQAIIQLLATYHQVSVHELAKQFNVAEETIRRDLNKLTELKLLKKVHGGAINTQSKFERTFNERAQVAIEEKQAIAMAAVKLIKPGDTLFIDFGTTTFELSKQIKFIDNLTIITNSPLLAGALYDNTTIETILIGGQLHSGKNACLGSIALKNVSAFFADYAVIGAGAIHVSQGVMDQDPDEAAIAAQMSKNSDKVIVLADSSKVNHHAVHCVMPWEQVDYLITTDNTFDLNTNKKVAKTQVIIAEHALVPDQLK